MINLQTNLTLIFNEIKQLFISEILFLESLTSLSNLQIRIFQVFTLLILLNLALILIVWNIYGQRISNRFIKVATSKEIEALKLSVSKLKLPKEHSPRF